MDDYSRYCFDVLKSTPEGTEYLREIGFETEQDILNLTITKTVSKEETGLVICKYCNEKDAIERSHQMRSIDEGESLVIYCRSCNRTYIQSH